MAGGALGGRCLPGEPVEGADIKVGLVAAAVNQDWLRPGHYHGMATANMLSLSIMFNPRDTILKRYWLLEPGSDALGAVGPETELRTTKVRCIDLWGRRPSG